MKLTNEIEEKYQAELKQAKLDHHKPTAGAMTGHILANLWYFDVKLHQAVWYLKGPQAISLQKFYRQLIAANRSQIDQLGDLLLDENQLPPATVSEYTQYAQLAENPRLKYCKSSQIVDETVQDFVTANLFIDRAIKLAQREERLVMAQHLIKMRGYNNQRIRQLQAVQNKNAWDNLTAVDDD
jgi:DNA-binding ferritin-like protein